MPGMRAKQSWGLQMLKLMIEFSGRFIDSESTDW